MTRAGSAGLFRIHASWAAIFALFMLFISSSIADPGEFKGIVTYVADGDTFYVEDFGRVRLADIDCPEASTPQGREAQDFTTSWLLNEIVFLDVDNTTGKDRYGRWICVAYLANPNGAVNVSMNFNRMLVDSGHAGIWNHTNNEFDPSDWWAGTSSSPVSDPVREMQTGTLKSNKGDDPTSEGMQNQEGQDRASFWPFGAFLEEVLRIIDSIEGVI